MLFRSGLWMGRNLNGTVYPLTLGVCAFSIGVALVAWTLVQRHGDPHGTSTPSPKTRTSA